MTLVLSAIAAGGLVGAANQYACLLVVGLAAKFGVIQLAAPMQFMGEWWFVGLVAGLWFITIAPSFSHYLAPGVMHVVNALVHFVSGFVVPVSSALISLAAVGVIVNLDPQLRAAFETLRIFNTDGALGPTGTLIAGGGAASAVALTGVKALAKPMISTSTGTVGHASAPMFAIAENVAAVVLMTLAYMLTKIDPWWLIGLFSVVVLVTLGLFAFGLYQLWRLKKGLGRLLYIAQVHPRAGLSIAVEFFVWGLGWLVWRNYARAVLSLLAWLVWLAVFISAQPIAAALFAIAPPLIPFALMAANFTLLAVFFFAGLGSARALMQMLEKEAGLPDLPKRGAVAA
jgi:hypothetical protein